MNLETMASGMSGAYQTAVGDRYDGVSQEKPDITARDQFASNLLRMRQQRQISAAVANPKITKIPEAEKIRLPIRKESIRGPIYETLPVILPAGIAEPAFSDAVQAEKTAAVAGTESVCGAEGRTILSNEQIDMLAGKYNVRNMSEEDYSAFLEDLENLGAISPTEKARLGQEGRSVPESSDGSVQDAGRELTVVTAWSWLGENPPAFKREETNGDILWWVRDRLKWTPEALTPEAAQREMEDVEMFENLSSILARMTGTAPVVGQKPVMVGEKAEANIIDQFADPNSALYEDMYNRMRLQLERSEEEKKKQAIIDALDAILESLSAKKDDWKKKPDSVSSMAELSRTIDSLDKDDPRKEELNLLRERLQNLGIYINLDVGIKDREETWGTTLTQQLIREEAKDTEPSILDII